MGNVKQVMYKGVVLTVLVDYQPSEPGNGVKEETTVEYVSIEGIDVSLLLEDQYDGILAAIEAEEESNI